jgi:hypothetical protein
MMFESKSEKVTREIEQLELKLEELEVRKAKHAEAKAGSEPPRKRPARQPLPREVHAGSARSHAPPVVRVALTQCVDGRYPPARLRKWPPCSKPSMPRKVPRQRKKSLIQKLKLMRLANAAEIVENAIDETLSYYIMPAEHWRCLRTNNPLERLMREVRRRTGVVGAFPNGQSATTPQCPPL